MKKSIISITLAAALLLAAPMAPAQEAEGPAESFLNIDSGNWISANLPEVGPRTLKHQEQAPDCPGNSLTITLHYPQGLGADIDRRIEKSVQDELASKIAEIKEGGFCDKNLCGGLSCGTWTADETFAAHSPSPGFLSILFTEFSDTGGAHPNTEYRVMNFKPDGRPLTLEDMFPDPAKSVPLYWDYVYAKWCAKHPYKYPTHYAAMQDCGSDSPDNPNIYEGAKTLDDLGRLVFSPLGATIVLGPYESGAYATGTITLDLPRRDLVKMGADPAIWGTDR